MGPEPGSCCLQLLLHPLFCAAPGGCPHITSCGLAGLFCSPHLQMRLLPPCAVLLRVGGAPQLAPMSLWLQLPSIPSALPA